MTPTRLAILGATGSIGQQALEVVRAHPDRLRVVALAANARATECAHLARELGVERVGIGTDALVDIATAPDVDLVLVATPGVAALRATLAALEAGKDVALANKEVLIAAGHLVMAAAGRAGKRLRPVDSEHSGLWQCLAGEDLASVRRVALTASGGAFRDLAPERLASVTPEQALHHPTWRMGPKVTVDSATLVNKAYEVIEAHWLYGLEYSRIEVVLHRESIVHALVEYADGSVKAQLAEPDMRLPIQFALLWDRAQSPARRLDWSSLDLGFRPIDRARYPCLDVVLDVARSGDAGALVGVQAADEIAVERFLDGELRFDGIAEVLRAGAEAGAREGRGRLPDLAGVIAIDAAVRASLTPAVAAR